MLISSVFEAAPPIVSKPMTPKKASITASRSDEHRLGNDSNGAEAPQSPLAKIFGESAKGHAGRGNSRSSEEEDNGAELQSVKDEVKAVRESQLRMEEMLAKVLSASK